MNGTLGNHDTEKAKDTVGCLDIFKKNWWILLVILLLAALVAWWPAFHPPIKVLICGLGLVLAVAVAYRLLRPRKKLDDALQESHYEKFRRLVGLYLTIPDAIRIRPENQAAVNEFESQRQQLESWIDKKTYKFTRDDASDFVHNLHLAFLQIATVDYLHFNIQVLEAEYRQAVGPTAYEAYLGAIIRKPTDPPVTPDERDRLVRAEATYLANETRRQQLLRQHVQTTRQRLLAAAFRSWWANIIPLLAILFVFVVCLSSVKTATDTPAKPVTKTPATTPTATPAETAPGAPTAKATTVSADNWTVHNARRYLLSADPIDPDNPEKNYTPLYKTLLTIGLLALSGIAGATGGMMSVIRRVQTNTPESDASTDLLVLSQAETAVFFAPVTGLIFAFVLSLFFAGGVLSGSVFPVFKTGSDWYLALFDGKSLAVWLLWAFVAGFCERLVPDALDNLAKQQADSNAKATPPAGARNLTPQNQGQTRGTDKDFKPDS